MAPLILHNVPDEELYIGDDGIQRPYAMLFPQRDSSGRIRKAAPETGSFGKSARRSRSKTATPSKREDPTIAAADKVFSSWLQEQNKTSAKPSTTTEAQPSATSSSAQQNQGQTDDGSPPPTVQTRFVKQQEPTEVILRGFPSVQRQYASINHYEQLAGRICEDYTREPPVGNRRYKSDLRDPALTRQQLLTPEERAKVNRVDGGSHWVKVTFESAEAADAAIFASPQSVQGYLVFAEPYRGAPPTRDEPVVDPVSAVDDDTEDRLRSSARRRRAKAASFSRHARSLSNPSFGDDIELSPPHSHTSSRTADTTTLTSNTETATVSSGTVTGRATTTGVDIPKVLDANDEFCRSIASVRKVKLLPAEQALLPQPSYTQRVVNQIPFLKWFSGSMIGNEVPRTDNGDFDWDRASLYWKFIFWLDSTFGLFGGEILSADKDD